MTDRVPLAPHHLEATLLAPLEAQRGDPLRVVSAQPVRKLDELLEVGLCRDRSDRRRCHRR